MIGRRRPGWHTGRTKGATQAVIYRDVFGDRDTPLRSFTTETADHARHAVLPAAWLVRNLDLRIHLGRR